MSPFIGINANLKQAALHQLETGRLDGWNPPPPPPSSPPPPPPPPVCGSLLVWIVNPDGFDSPLWLLGSGEGSRRCGCTIGQPCDAQTGRRNAHSRRHRAPARSRRVAAGPDLVPSSHTDTLFAVRLGRDVQGKQNRLCGGRRAAPRADRCAPYVRAGGSGRRVRRGKRSVCVVLSRKNPEWWQECKAERRNAEAARGRAHENDIIQKRKEQEQKDGRKAGHWTGNFSASFKASRGAFLTPDVALNLAATRAVPKVPSLLLLLLSFTRYLSSFNNLI